MIHGRLGGDFGIGGLGVPEITDPCIFDGVNDEGVTGTYFSWFQVELTSTWNPHTPFTYGKVKTYTYPR